MVFELEEQVRISCLPCSAACAPCCSFPGQCLLCLCLLFVRQRLPHSLAQVLKAIQITLSHWNQWKLEIKILLRSRDAVCKYYFVPEYIKYSCGSQPSSLNCQTDLSQPPPYKIPKSQTLITTPLKDPRNASLGVSFPSCNCLIFLLTNFKSIWCRLHRFSFKSASHRRSKTNSSTFTGLADNGSLTSFYSLLGITFLL